MHRLEPLARSLRGFELQLPHAGGCAQSLGLVVLLFVLASPLLAKSWRISDYQDTIGISPNGKAVITERITLVFAGEWHGIHRTIPVEYPGPNGTNYTLFLDVTSVTDSEGHSLRYVSHKSGSYRDLKIQIPDAVDTTKVVVIDYAVRNGIRYFDQYDEFYWNVTGNDWPVPIDGASAFVHFPDNAAGSLRAQSFTGAYGSTGHEAAAEVKGADVSFATTSPLPMRGGLTIDVYIPKGILQEPSAVTRLAWFMGSNPIVFLPVVTLGVMFALWWYKGRDPDPGMSIAPMYEPPKDISPAEAGTLIDDTIHPRDITATLVDLAVRGYLKIAETIDQGLLFHHKDYVFDLLKPRDPWANDLQPYERVMLENVFLGGAQTRLSSLRNRFYTAIPVIRQDIMSSLRRKGMYLLDPESANGYSIGAAIVILAPFAIAQFIGYANFFDSITSLIAAVLVAALIWWPFAREMTAKTVKGGRTRVAVLGFQEFIHRVEEDRLKRMPPDTFEKFLPYAMALGIEHVWAQKFTASCKTRRTGTFPQRATRRADSIRSSSPIPCTSCPTRCIRCSSRPRAPVPPARVGAEEVSQVGEAFPAEASAGAVAARSKCWNGGSVAPHEQHRINYRPIKWTACPTQFRSPRVSFATENVGRVDNDLKGWTGSGSTSRGGYDRKNKGAFLCVSPERSSLPRLSL